ncbi:hypothetical protein GK047_18710 [Paenibacillus sp. SYP-B3998]|uniref:Uncharacterized protein n=1 Tax=Paenibacillus sp. SYP-B3998 TaxID=2678564 RepID=A0A6G4A0Y7_9BACL|nr:hypothetical protein [Paenibacillus sp. SYP-B3998]NEW08035.1 hypothetical protein [Paenibacillus sp. SYP-B3998]
MKTISKKILTGTMIASFVLGVGFVGALHNQAYADTASGTSSSSSVQKSDKAGPDGHNGQGRGGFGDRGGHQGGGKGEGFRGNNLVKQTATVLGVEQNAVQEALKAGKTLAAYAVEQGVTEADYLQKLVAAETTSITAGVTAGKITQEQADKILSGLSDRLTKQIENTRPEGGHGGRPGGHWGPGGGFFGNAETLASILGITQDELRTQQEAGKSIADIAAAKGISEDNLISKIKEGMTDSIKKFVENKDGFKHSRPEEDAQAEPAAPASNSTN